jgi:hypothetical protein
MNNKAFFGLAIFLIISCLSSICLAQDATVYGEAAWRDDATGQDVVVYLYTDINPASDPLISFGIRLTYPSELTLDSVNTGTNKEVWYFGTQASQFPYTDVYEESGTEVVVIGGKLDEDFPTEGVSGERVLLAVARFTFSSGATMPPVIGLTYGRPGDYKDFVDNGGAVLDDTAGAVLFDHPRPDKSVPIIVAERGDANADGSVNISDVTEIRKMVFGQIPAAVYGDCDANLDPPTGIGIEVSISDVTCIRDKVFQQ